MKRRRADRIAAALLGALLLTACGGSWSEEDLRFFASLPSRDALTAKLPQETQSQQALTGSVSPLFQDTRASARRFNGGIAALLDGLERATRRPPSARAPGVRVWGPYPHPRSREHEVRLVVRWVEVLRDDDPTNDGDPDHFEHALQVRRRGEDDLAWQSVLGGAFIPGAGSAGPRAGTGRLILDADALRAAGIESPDLDALSRLDVVYDLRAWPRAVGVVLTPAGAAAGEVRYAYLEGQRGGGLLRFVLQRDLVSGPGIETLVVGSAWQPEGPGRAMARVEGGDLARPARTEECWDAAGRLLFSRDWQGREEGRRLDCPPLAPPEPVDP